MSDTNQSFLDRHYFLIRRLHSLSGIFPVGAFLFPHLTANSSIVWGRVVGGTHASAEALHAAGLAPDGGIEHFQNDVDFIHSLPALPLIEFGVLFLPILFHAVVGVWFAKSSSVNVDRYRYQANWRYALQRLTGYLGILFIFMHVMSLRFGWTFFGLMPAFDADRAASSVAIHFQQGAWGLVLAGLYLVFVLSLVFHFANGLWTAAITWGLTVSAPAQRRWGYVCTAVGILLSGAAIAAVVGFSTLDIEDAQRYEDVLASADHS